MQILISYAELRSFIEVWESTKAEEQVAFKVTDPSQVWVCVQAKASFEDDVLYEQLNILIPITAETVAGSGCFTCKIGELASALRAIEPDDGQVTLTVEEDHIAIGTDEAVHIPFTTLDTFPPLNLPSKNGEFDLEYDEDKKAILFRVEKKEKLQTIYVEDLYEFGKVTEYFRLRQLFEDESFVIPPRLDEDSTYIVEQRTPRRVRREQTEKEIMPDDPKKCIACEGTGKNSHGRECLICKGASAVEASDTPKDTSSICVEKYADKFVCLLCEAVEYSTEKGMTRHYNKVHSKIKWRDGVHEITAADEIKEIDLSANVISGAALAAELGETAKEPEESSYNPLPEPANAAPADEGASSEEPSSEEEKTRRRTKEEILNDRIEAAKTLLFENGYEITQTTKAETVDELVGAIMELSTQMRAQLVELTQKAVTPAPLSKDELLRQLALQLEN